MNHGRFVAAIAAALSIVGPGSLDAADPPKAGTIKGRFVWAEGPVPRRRDLFAPTPQPVLSEDLLVDPKTRGLANAFVFLAGIGPTPLPVSEKERARVVLDQVDYRFAPHALALHASQTLVIRSSDPLGHNARWSSTACAFNVMVGASSDVEVRVLAGDLRIRPVVCDIHSWMKGVMMVFDHPYFDLSRADGRFEIRGVPPGSHRLVLLHETLGYLDPAAAKGRPVSVKAGETTDLGDIPVKPRPELQLKAAP